MNNRQLLVTFIVVSLGTGCIHANPKTAIINSIDQGPILPSKQQAIKAQTQVSNITNQVNTSNKLQSNNITVNNTMLNRNNNIQANNQNLINTNKQVNHNKINQPQNKLFTFNQIKNDKQFINSLENRTAKQAEQIKRHQQPIKTSREIRDPIVQALAPNIDAKHQLSVKQSDNYINRLTQIVNSYAENREKGAEAAIARQKQLAQKNRSMNQQTLSLNDEELQLTQDIENKLERIAIATDKGTCNEHYNTICEILYDFATKQIKPSIKLNTYEDICKNNNSVCSNLNKIWQLIIAKGKPYARALNNLAKLFDKTRYLKYQIALKDIKYLINHYISLIRKIETNDILTQKGIDQIMKTGQLSDLQVNEANMEDYKPSANTKPVISLVNQSQNYKKKLFIQQKTGNKILQSNNNNKNSDKEKVLQKETPITHEVLKQYTEKIKKLLNNLANAPDVKTFEKYYTTICKEYYDVWKKYKFKQSKKHSDALENIWNSDSQNYQRIQNSWRSIYEQYRSNISMNLNYFYGTKEANNKINQLYGTKEANNKINQLYGTKEANNKIDQLKDIRNLVKDYINNKYISRRTKIKRN